MSNQELMNRIVDSAVQANQLDAQTQRMAVTMFRLLATFPRGANPSGAHLVAARPERAHPGGRAPGAGAPGGGGPFHRRRTHPVTDRLCCHRRSHASPQRSREPSNCPRPR